MAEYFWEPYDDAKTRGFVLFPSELGNWFSYIILLEDGNKLDLTLIPINEVEDYFSNSDGLVVGWFPLT